MVLFDPLTGQVKQKVPRFVVYPASHYVTPRDEVVRAIQSIKKELSERLDELNKAGKLVEAQRLQQRTLFDLEMLDQVGFCKGIENYSRHLTGLAPGEAPPCLIDYLPADSIMFFDESHVMMGQLGAMYRGDRSRKETLVNYGFRLPSAMDNRPLRFDEFERKMRRAVFVSATPAAYELEKSAQVVEQVVRPTGLVDPEVEVRPATSQVDDVLSEVNDRAKAGERVLVTTLTKRMAEELTEFCASTTCAYGTCTRTSTPSSAWKSSATCARGSLTCSWASTSCERASTFPKCPWWRFSTPTRKAFAFDPVPDSDHRPRGP